jgi:hypothetical protein
MFSFNYKLKTVNPEKGIVRLTPTTGTYVKYFAPAFVFYGGLFALGSYLRWQEKRNEELMNSTDSEN